MDTTSTTTTSIINPIIDTTSTTSNTSLTTITSTTNKSDSECNTNTSDIINRMKCSYNLYRVLRMLIDLHYTNNTDWRKIVEQVYWGYTKMLCDKFQLRESDKNIYQSIYHGGWSPDASGQVIENRYNFYIKCPNKIGNCENQLHAGNDKVRTSYGDCQCLGQLHKLENMTNESIMFVLNTCNSFLNPDDQQNNITIIKLLLKLELWNVFNSWNMNDYNELNTYIGDNYNFQQYVIDPRQNESIRIYPLYDLITQYHTKIINCKNDIESMRDMLKWIRNKNNKKGLLLIG